MVVSCKKEINDRKYIEHNGKPILFYGVQLRTDDAMQSGCNEEQIENYFKKAKECNFEMVAIPVGWKAHIEKYVGSSSDSPFVERMIYYIQKYDLLVQWLWFGSNVCCSQDEMPSGVSNSEIAFRKRMFNNEEVIDYSDPLLLEREKAALKCFLDMLSRLDKQKRTVCIQIENEPNFNDFLAQRKEYLSIMDELGKAVKESDFSVFTRVNTTAPEIYLGEDPLLSQISDLEGIDAVGVDVYNKNVDYFTQFAEYMNSIEGNFGHFAEVGAHVYNLPQIICDIFQRGNGVFLYELRTTSIRRDYECGVFRKSDDEWIERDGTEQVQYQWTAGETIKESNTDDLKLLNKMIIALETELAITSTENIAMILNGIEENVGEYRVSFNTDEDSYNNFAMAIVADDGYLYCFTLSETGVLNIDGMDDVKVSNFSDGDWNTSDINSIPFTIQRGYVYRIG